MNKFLHISLWLLVITGFFSACTVADSESPNTGYFNLKPLITAQIDYLRQGGGVQLEKVSLVNTEKDSVVVSYAEDSASWARELQVLLDLDIDKTRNTGMYTEKLVEDSSSNLTIRFYEHTGEDPKVPQLRIYFLDNMNQPKKIKGVFRDSNLGFISEREIEIEWDIIHGKNRLSSYKVSGQQRVILQDTVQYQLTSRFIYP